MCPFSVPLPEALSDPAVVAQLSDTKAADEVKALNEFFRILGEDSDRAFYGYDYVVAANNHKAIDVLLLTDELFRWGLWW